MAKKIGRSDTSAKGEWPTSTAFCPFDGLDVFYPTGGVEAGIDGFIELRDEETGTVGNLLLQVQGKATERQRLQGETDDSFEFPCSEDDIRILDARHGSGALRRGGLPERGRSPTGSRSRSGSAIPGPPEVPKIDLRQRLGCFFDALQSPRSRPWHWVHHKARTARACACTKTFWSIL